MAMAVPLTTSDIEQPLDATTKDTQSGNSKDLLVASLLEKHCRSYGTCDDEALVDNMTYTMARMKSWKTLWSVHRTVWESAYLWKIVSSLYLLAFITAFLAYNLLSDPGLLDTEKFSNITTVMTVFVSLTLSFFLSSAVSRWGRTVDGFEQIFNSIRMLSLQLHALGAESEPMNKCLRYALLSAYFLVSDLITSQAGPQKRKDGMKEMIRALENSPDMYAHLTTTERINLEKHPGDRPYQMWLWIATLLGRMAKDKIIPGMQTPTYGRIMNLAQQCQEGLRTVRAAVLVQMPYRYVHVLAFLVHVECILLSISLGLSLGVSYHGLRQYADHYYLVHSTNTTVVPAHEITPLTTQIQTLIVEGIKGVFAPLLYQAFLDIGVTISSPFTSPEAAIPVQRLLEELGRDLKQANILLEELPSWEKPCFSG